MLTQKELKAKTVEYVRDMSKHFESTGSKPMSEETIQYTADRVFKAIYPSVAKDCF